ncbi:unnamed protein product [Darwinula stevensoni]|uniref:GAIN-B domain-containing protein n=1 Tax=Darwinula stevensoni TaxID=69355 RepID=A0A7R8XCT8_9CRUS|nr:unnamed protein product [Darwinula stevensoni]CAG0886102.1 unnamed protein product [Darwinula stevensoni]
MQLNELNALETLKNLTSEIESKENLSGEEIEAVTDFLGPLLDAFLNGLQDGQGDSVGPLEFLQSLTVAVDLTLDAFEGWLNITEGTRSETFSSLTETMAKAGLEIAYFLFNHHDEELAFHMSKKHLVVEAWGKQKNSGSFVFPNGGGHTYAELPDGFQDQLGGGDHYFVIGVLYDVEDLNSLLPSDNSSFGEEMKTNSWLLSLAVRHDQQLQLEKPLQLTFMNEEPPRVPPYRKGWWEIHEGESPTFMSQSHLCTFWNMQDERWDDEGCRMVSTGRDQTICECSHLTNFAVLIDINAQAPNETSTLETLKNLTSWIENEVELSGEEIQNIVNSLAELLDDFLVDLQNGQVDPSDPKEFLLILTKAVDLTLDAFQGWLNITKGVRSETFSSLTETLAKAGLEIVFSMFDGFDEELAFNVSRDHLVVEATRKPMNSSDSVVFPKERGHTYAELPAGFQNQLGGGDHYFVVGVLYDVEDLNSLLPSDNTSELLQAGEAYSSTGTMYEDQTASKSSRGAPKDFKILSMNNRLDALATIALVFAFKWIVLDPHTQNANAGLFRQNMAYNMEGMMDGEGLASFVSCPAISVMCEKVEAGRGIPQMDLTLLCHFFGSDVRSRRILV